MDLQAGFGFEGAQRLVVDHRVGLGVLSVGGMRADDQEDGDTGWWFTGSDHFKSSGRLHQQSPR